MSKYPQAQQERLNYLEFRLYFAGQISRSDLIKRFGISQAAATRDLAIYRDEAPQNLDFDKVTKCYRISESFRPIHIGGVEPRHLLRALVHGVGNDFGSLPEIIIPCELPSLQEAPATEILAPVSRAISQKRVLQIEYLSKSGDYGLREIVPFSLAGTGLRWVVRAYCRRKGIFSDFVLNRMRSAKVLMDSVPKEIETKEFDDDWNRMLKLELIPHPTAKPEIKAMTEQEYRMTDGVHILRVRASLAGYLLRLWSVDCSEDRRLTMLPLCIKNRITLHDVETAKMAPGYLNQKDFGPANS